MFTVVALGGNAFSSGAPGLEEDRLQAAAEDVLYLLTHGRVVVTHGNGPQVSAILSGDHLNLWEAVACTQGWMGASLADVLETLIRKRGLNTKVVVLITRVVTKPSSTWFKPIGEPLDQLSASQLVGAKLMRDSKGRLRRAVPSPEPLSIVEIDAINMLVKEGFLVICCGGGGVPVAEGERVEAVVDKDLASQVLANDLGADRLIILTDTDFVYLNYGTAQQRPLSQLKVEEAMKLYAMGQFGEGSMGPKVLAAARFIKNGGKEAYIGKLGRIREILSREEGTEVIQ
jgi:Carbamate kinase